MFPLEEVIAVKVLTENHFKMFVQITRFLILSLFFAHLNCWIRLEDVQCLSSNKTVSSNYSCYVKKFGPRNASINVEFFVVKKKVNFFWVCGRFIFGYWSVNWSVSCLFQLKFQCSYGKTSKGPFVSILNFEKLKYCDLVASSKTHPVFVWLINRAPALVNFIHHCPYGVRITHFYEFGEHFLSHSRESKRSRTFLWALTPFHHSPQDSTESHLKFSWNQTISFLWIFWPKQFFQNPTEGDCSFPSNLNKIQIWFNSP